MAFKEIRYFYDLTYIPSCPDEIYCVNIDTNVFGKVGLCRPKHSESHAEADVTAPRQRQKDGEPRGVLS